MSTQQTEALPALIERFRGLHFDHAPDGWPAVRTREITALLDRITELESQLAQRFGAADVATAAQAVVDHWDTPLWKDVPATAEYIGRLRAALAAGQATAAPAQPVAQQGVAYAAQQASTVTNYTTLGAAMRAIRQSIQMIGDPEDECMRAVKRVLRGAVIIVEDSGDEVAAPAAPAQPDPAYSAACHLATALFKKYFAHLPDFASGQAVWGLCGSTAGVISQIDNMVSGLLQPPTTAFSEDEL